MNTSLINCEGMCHSLSIKADEDFKTVNIGLWNYGFNDGKLSLKNRLEILFNGRADADLVILNKTELEKLIKALEDARERIS